MGCNNSKSVDINKAQAPESNEASAQETSDNAHKNTDNTKITSPNKDNEEENVEEINERIMYVNGLSAFARTTMMVAYLCDVKINYVNVDLQKGEQMQEWFLKINPKHTVPVLIDGDMTITESVDISKHLIDKFGQQKCKLPIR